MKRLYIASGLLVFGVLLSILSYSYLYSLKGEIFDSSNVPLQIAALTSNERSFFTSIGSDLKKVSVYVDNVAGEGWINHPFEMSLLNGKGDSLTMIQTTPTPGGGYYMYDIPSSWSTLGGVRISNPEGYAVTVNVEFFFWRQIINLPWLIAMVTGIILALAGILLIVRHRKSA